MIDHTGFNVSDLELSKAFYLQALAPLGYGISLEFEGAAGFGAQTGAGDDPGGDRSGREGQRPARPHPSLTRPTASYVAVSRVK